MITARRFAAGSTSAKTDVLDYPRSRAPKVRRWTCTSATGNAAITPPWRLDFDI